MKEYDVIVIGSGSGLSLVYKALADNLNVALVAKDYLGGTCLNVGCVPSKTLIHPADKIVEIEEARKLGVTASIVNIDFGGIMERTRSYIKKGTDRIRNDLITSEGLDFYEAEAHFIADYTLLVQGEQIRGRKIFIASGARPLIPPIGGLDASSYLTNETLLQLKARPESMVIIGGSYIGVEYAHFFAAMGTRVTVVEMTKRLIPFEEPEISELLKRKMQNRMEVYTDATAIKVNRQTDNHEVLIRDNVTGEERTIPGQTILVAAGRISNADRLQLANTGVETGRGNFITVDDYLMTTKENIWAVGDATGKQMFTHAADREVEVAWVNATQPGEKVKMDFSSVPHAVFSHPPIASIGLTEEEAAKTHEILVGKAQYSDIVQGDARMEEEGFAKAIADKATRRILGFHIIGPEAPELIQEVVNMVANGVDIEAITESMHIFPSLSELVPEALGNLE
ncbi:MAG: Mercuric reductase [Syntrophorhabdus sp. PtaU1.Bin153]|nr:MAG: Mercuric reductase [Syntrophorhabdus sp. PtaU1.Bin153]